MTHQASPPQIFPSSNPPNLGRVASKGFLPSRPRASRNRDVPSSTTVAIPPEEALFRRRGAPQRNEENDFYWADRHLKEGQILPDSDLLKAVHEYASEFYGRRGGPADFESLDETALLAVGILLEEWMGSVGEEWGVFVEAEEGDESDVEEEEEEGEEEEEEEEEEKEEEEEMALDADEGSEERAEGRWKKSNAASKKEADEISPVATNVPDKKWQSKSKPLNKPQETYDQTPALTQDSDNPRQRKRRKTRAPLNVR